MKKPSICLWFEGTNFTESLNVYVDEVKTLANPSTESGARQRVCDSKILPKTSKKKIGRSFPVHLK